MVDGMKAIEVLANRLSEEIVKNTILLTERNELVSEIDRLKKMTNEGLDNE